MRSLKILHNVASKLGTRGGSADAPTTHLPVTLFLDQDDDSEAVMTALNALGFVEVCRDCGHVP